ncbi:hypothetical protein QE412_002452 [Microbacterium trichothecenolyticum]|uniref:Microcystin LR degradation protein MlrC N-terminal domain-containing protein n=1 Tax=Microbacterium trichothecenolyticum TaxID=69370 RepID=A0ABU0TW46_MICTR|nr:hypothetical protein [Microbacterium trichothecenolyticum]
MIGRLPRIAIVGMAIESSAYAAHRAGYADFAVLSDAQVLTRYAFLASGTPLGDAAEWIGVFYARSIPGGQVRPDVYHDFRARITAGLADIGDVDAVYLDVHGAMGVEGMDDAEGDLVQAVRAVIGAEPLIAAPMDLHGNVSERFARAVRRPADVLSPRTPRGRRRDARARGADASRVDRTRPAPRPRLGAGSDPAARREDVHPRGTGASAVRAARRRRRGARGDRRLDLDRLRLGRRTALPRDGHRQRLRHRGDHRAGRGTRACAVGCA